MTRVSNHGDYALGRRGFSLVSLAPIDADRKCLQELDTVPRAVIAAAAPLPGMLLWRPCSVVAVPGGERHVIVDAHLSSDVVVYLFGCQDPTLQTQHFIVIIFLFNLLDVIDYFASLFIAPYNYIVDVLWIEAERMI